MPMPSPPVPLPPGVQSTLEVLIGTGVVLANAFVVLVILRASHSPTLRGFAKFLTLLLSFGNTTPAVLVISIASVVTDQWQYRETFCRRTILNSYACSLATLSAMVYFATRSTR
ncbi:Hypp287 [Branchiostoma lanceolatum]|uniref:Hypp287 protein n=1 Tax=Branchiostoma lanceolatum TaxID=7740 RepID=A0A8J9V9N4_BRALA|nr:Hypp287 [Branchiostoma lanceolatum]